MSKATADGLIAPFARLDVDIDAALTLRDGPPPYLPDAWRLHAIAVPAGFLATLAVWRKRQRGHAGFASVNCSCSADICRSHLSWCAAFFA